VPPVNLFFQDSHGKTPPERCDQPFSTMIFGGLESQDLTELVEIVVWCFDVHVITGIEFHYKDASKNLVFGAAGPFDDFPMERQLDPPDDLRVSMTIDGPKGEIITAIEVLCNSSCLTGLKVY
jgi:hypothetical protein